MIVGEEWQDKEKKLTNVKDERSKRLREERNIFHLVSAAWLEASVRENRLVSEGEYLL